MVSVDDRSRSRESARSAIHPSDSGSHASLEIEWQFDAPDPRAVERWVLSRAREGAWRAERGAPEEILDDYFDTPDLRFQRAGYALRVRSGAVREATLKEMRLRESGVARRREITERLGARSTLGRLRGPVGRRVRAVRGSRRIVRLFTIRTSRRVIAVAWPSGGRAEVVFDETRVLEPDGTERSLPHRVEIELVSGPMAAARSFVRELSEALHLAPSAFSKYAEGLRGRPAPEGFTPDLGPREITRLTPAADAAYAVLRTRFEAYLAAEPGVRLGEDPGPVHDMRVASRRLRASLRLFEDVLPRTAGRWHATFADAAAALGRVRDLDVLLENVRASAPRLASGPDAVAPVLDRLTARREEEHGALLARLDSKRYAAFIDGFTRWLRRGSRPRVREAGEPIALVAPRLAGHRHRAMRRAASRLTPASPESYHRLRIRAKRLRYALEALEPAYGKPFHSMLRPLAKIQDALGAEQDAVVAVPKLREMVQPNTLAPEAPALQAIEEIARAYDARARQQRARVPRLLAALSGKRWQRLERALDRERRRAASKREGG